ncbi:MAG TPA: hypothetical protein VEW47_11745 [Candidatus Dormibacteraeota bacterium]|nr:hypothetical protein [Candidatus Dormibacteraeota bacterium]
MDEPKPLQEMTSEEFWKELGRRGEAVVEILKELERRYPVLPLSELLAKGIPQMEGIARMLVARGMSGEKH